MSSFGKKKVNCRKWVNENLEYLVSSKWADWRFKLYSGILGKCGSNLNQKEYLNRIFGAQICIFNVVCFEKMKGDFNLTSALYEEIEKFCSRIEDGEEIRAAYRSFSSLGLSSLIHRIKMHVAIATDITVRLSPMDKGMTSELAGNLLFFEDYVRSQIRGCEFFEECPDGKIGIVSASQQKVNPLGALEVALRRSIQKRYDQSVNRNPSNIFTAIANIFSAFSGKMAVAIFLGLINVIELLGFLVAVLWLVVLREWGSLIIGIIWFFLHYFLVIKYVFPLMLMGEFAVVKLDKKGHKIKAVFCTFFHSCAVAAILYMMLGISCLFVARADSQSVIPLLIWSYVLTFIPWRGCSPGNQNLLFCFVVFFAKISYVIAVEIILSTHKTEYSIILYTFWIIIIYGMVTLQLFVRSARNCASKFMLGEGYYNRHYNMLKTQGGALAEEYKEWLRQTGKVV